MHVRTTGDFKESYVEALSICGSLLSQVTQNIPFSDSDEYRNRDLCRLARYSAFLEAYLRKRRKGSRGPERESGGAPYRKADAQIFIHQYLRDIFPMISIPYVGQLIDERARPSFLQGLRVIPR